MSFLKTVIYNNDNVKKEEINKYVYRARGLIINSENEILLGKCDGNYQFPEGHLEFGETIDECLKREIKEETGIILKESYPLIYKVEYYNRNFPLEGDVIYTEFNYFLIRTDDLPNKNNMNLDEWEKEHNYECVYIKLEDLDDLLNTTMNDHHMNKIVYKEIKATIKEYYKYIKDER